MSLKVIVLLFVIIVGFSANAKADSQLTNANYITTQSFNIEDEHCCERCNCKTLYDNNDVHNIDKMCQCLDIEEYCHPSCNSCFCTKSNPPQCQCDDWRYAKCYIPRC
ncbi:hypothetical protein HN51_028410 [Arachis hypogaea]|nr:Bowman-Birk type proteinase inhibitor [Arachis hypogaea]